VNRFNSFLVLLISFSLYLYTSAPTIIGGDSSGFCLSVHNLSLSLGSADDHPLYLILGKLFSFLPFELSYSLNLMSVFFGSLTVFLVFLAIKHITRSNPAAFFGSFSLMVSHAFWQHCVIAEVYTLHTFFLALLIYITLVWLNYGFYKYLFPLIFILGLLNHIILILTLPAFLFYILTHIDGRRKRLLLRTTTVLIALILLSSVWLIVYEYSVLMMYLDSILLGSPPVAHYLTPPKDWLSLVEELKFYFLYLFYQYPFFCILLGAIGLFRFFKNDKSTAFFLLLIMLLNGLFFIKTTSWPSYGGTKYTFYITDYLIFSIFLGYGSLSLFKWLGSFLGRFSSPLGTPRIKLLSTISAIVLLLIATVGFYSIMPRLASYLNIDLLNARTLPYRDNNAFFLTPNKRGYSGDRRFGEKILDLAERNSVIFADFTPYTILRYLTEIENKRTDILLIHSKKEDPIIIFIDEIRQDRPNTCFYVVDNNSYYDLHGVSEKYSLRKAGPIFEIVPRNGPAVDIRSEQNDAVTGSI